MGRSLEERFWEKVDRRGPDECWPWKARLMNTGYGWFCRDGRMRLAHRVAYELGRGEPPGDLCVLHSCDNRQCVNPAHLRLGTKRDNSDDMIAKGRARKAFGSGHPHVKLSVEQVIEIKRRLAEGEAVTPIARSFGVDHGTVHAIKRGRSWRRIA